MLRSYFAIDISDDSRLLALPQVVDNYVPDWTALPRLMLRLATKVSYTHEKEASASCRTRVFRCVALVCMCQLTHAHLARFAFFLDAVLSIDYYGARELFCSPSVAARGAATGRRGIGAAVYGSICAVRFT